MQLSVAEVAGLRIRRSITQNFDFLLFSVAELNGLSLTLYIVDTLEQLFLSIVRRYSGEF